MEKTKEAPQDPGDDSGVLRAYLQWCDRVEDVTRGTDSNHPSVCTVLRREGGAWELVFAVRRSPTRRQVHFVRVSVDRPRPGAWFLVKLAPGVWDSLESIHVPGQIHAFVTLVGVPDPAPWEALPTLPTSG